MAEENKPKKKTAEVLADNLQKVVIIVVSIMYVSQGLFAFTKKDATLWETLGSIAFSVVLGMIFSTTMKSMGLKDGRKSELFNQSMKTYGETKEKATPYFDKLQAWCSYKNSVELNLRRREIIQDSGLKWKLFRIGYYDKNIPTEKNQVAALEKAKKCKIEPLKPNELLCDLPSSRFSKKRFGESEADFKARNAVSDFIFKVGIGVICGMYGLAPLLTEDNWQVKLAGILWNTTQIGMWIAFGLMGYRNAKAFIEDEYRQSHLIQKTEYLNEFIVTCQNNPKIIEDYDEDKEIDQFLEELNNERRKNELDSGDGAK